jgi:hypothetical protein
MKEWDLYRFLILFFVFNQIHSEENFQNLTVFDKEKDNLTGKVNLSSHSELSYNQTIDDGLELSMTKGDEGATNSIYSESNRDKPIILEEDINSLTDLYKNRTDEDDFNLTEFMKSMEEKDEEEIDSDTLLEDIEKVDLHDKREGKTQSLLEFEKQISNFDAAEILTFQIPYQEKEVSFSFLLKI